MAGRVPRAIHQHYLGFDSAAWDHWDWCYVPDDALALLYGNPRKTFFNNKKNLYHALLYTENLDENN